jgi:hypothetical protein
METCQGSADAHEEIVYNCRKCPLCQAMDELKEQQKELELLQKELNEVERA